MQSENEHIKEFLSDYAKLNSPEYAVLIRGEWGTGKSWFIIKKVFNLDNKDKKILYVSLNGMSSTKDIENDFLTQLHPLLNHTNMRRAGRILAGTLKATLKIDLNNDGSSDSVNINLPNEKLLESLNLSDDALLIFDDLERCSIPIVNVLGYINQFVEHEGLKVILIANEEEIDTNNKEYKRIKEKLVGKTFEVQPNVKTALEHFISLLNKQDVFNENSTVIVDIFKSYEKKNLRILKYALQDFERVLQKLPDEILNNKPLISGFLKLFLAHSFEIKSGNISPEDIADQIAILLLKHTNKEKTHPYDKHVISKYTSINFYDLRLSSKIWDDIFTRGIVPIDELNKSLKNSQYFLAEKVQDSWDQLWYGRLQSDADFEKILQDVEKKWAGFEYDDIGIVRHIAGIFFWLSGVNLYPKSNEEILTHAKLFIDKLKERGNEFFHGKSSIYTKLFPDEGYAGLGFHGKEFPEFSQLFNYINEKKLEAIRDSYPSEAAKLVELMKNNALEFCQNLVAHYGCDSEVVCKFYKIPILSHMSVDDFVNTFVSLNQNDRQIIADIFNNRYDQYALELTVELDWLKNVTKRLEEIANQRTGKMSGYSIGLMIDQNFKIAIERFENEKQRLEMVNEFNNARFQR